jgi:hypothetical protein
MARPKIDPIIKFHQKYVVDKETGCWEWKDKLGHNGYGRLQFDKKSIQAHRFSYEHFNDHLKEGFVICHTCHNRKCVNPEHLRQDTQSSNMIDMIHCKNGKDQVLSIEEVIEIKKALQFYYRGQCKDLAHFYKVTDRTIYHIKTGTRWSHVKID